MKLFHRLIGKTLKLSLIVNHINNWIASRPIPNKVKRIAAVAIMGVSVVLAINLGIAIITTMSTIVPLSISLIIVALLFLPESNQAQASQQTNVTEDTDFSPLYPSIFLTGEPVFPLWLDKDVPRVKATDPVEDLYQGKEFELELRRIMLEESLKRE